MKITFKEATGKALKEFMKSKENKVIRLKVLAFGCGKPALGIILDGQKSDDVVESVDGITFVVEPKQQIYFENTEILYDPQVFNGGFHVHSTSK